MTEVDWNNNRAVYIATSDISEPRDLFGVETKFKESTFKNNNQTTRTWFCRQNGQVAQYRIGIQIKKMVVVPVCLNYRCCSSECLVLYRINKDESNESLPLLAFRRDVINAIFLKSSEEGRSSARHVGIRNLPSDVCYDNTKYCQVLSEKQGRCKVCKKNSRRRCIKCKVYMHSMKYAWYAYICMVCMVLKYLMDISECLTAWCYKMYELVLCNILFNYVLKYVLFFFFLVFLSRRLPVTFDVQIDLKMKHP